MPPSAALLLLAAAALAPAAAPPAIFPAPREIALAGEPLALAATVPILLPERPSAEDEFLAGFLVAELSDRHGLALRTRRVRALPSGVPFILVGSLANPLVAAYARDHALSSSAAEGYALVVGPGAAVVAGTDAAGAFYGLQSLRQLLRGSGPRAQIRAARVRDWPFKPFRGIKLYLPGRQNVPYFKRFIRDFMALYKFNTVIVEMNASMRFDRHPELNAGWLEMGKDLNYTRRERSPGPGRQFQDSANADSGDFGLLEKEEVAELVRYARRHHVEFMPEIPSLTHSYYLLTRHRELAEMQDAEWPDTYCPSEPKVYDLLFDVLDEFIEVMRPTMIHVGHDEWRMPVGACRRCAGKDPTDLFAADLNKIYAHLKSRGVRTAIWGDHLIEPLRGRKVQAAGSRRGTSYYTPGALSPGQVKRLVPKDILIFNWFWDNRRNEDLVNGLGEPNEVALSDWGFQQVYGNFGPHIRDFDRRAVRPGILGGAPSSWAATNELNFGKDMMWEYLGCANLLWSTDRPDMPALSATAQSLLPGIRRNLSGRTFPSDDNPVVELAPGPAAGAAPVPVGMDASSLIFRHACARPARNSPAFTGTWNYADTAELVGWYEVVYEDGLTESVPLRYGVNILESGWARAHAPRNLAYEAEAVPAGDGTLFAFEWINPRFGKPIKEVRLHTAKPANPVHLGSLGAVPKRTPPEPRPLVIIDDPARFLK